MDRESLHIADLIESTPSVKRKRVTYGELDKIKITKYANTCEIANAVVKCKGEFLSLTERTVREQTWQIHYL